MTQYTNGFSVDEATGRVVLEDSPGLTFPPTPTAMPQLGGDGVAPYIRFVAGE